MKTCIPVQAENWSELKKQVAAASTRADMIEIWVDHLPDGDQKRVREIKKMTDKKIVIAVKPRRERGRWKGSEIKRLNLLLKCARAGADYIDVGMDTDAKLIRMLKKNMGKKAKLILSYHNFVLTPRSGILMRIIGKAGRLGADIVKVATMARSVRDNVTVMGLYGMKGTIPLVALCMGKYGKISRVAAPVLGAPWTYVALEKKRSSAPGQLTVNEYNGIAKILANE